MQRWIITLTGLCCILAMAIAPMAHAQTTSSYSFEVRGGGYTPGGDSNEIAIYKGSTLLSGYDIGYNPTQSGPIVTWGTDWSNLPQNVVNFTLTYDPTGHTGSFAVSGYYGPTATTPTIYTTSFTTPSNFVLSSMSYAVQANKLDYDRFGVARDGLGDAVNLTINGLGTISTISSLVGPVAGALSYIDNILTYTGSIAFINQCSWHEGDVRNQLAAITLTGNTISPVPLPGAIWLLGSGIVGLVGFRRRARNG